MKTLTKLAALLFTVIMTSCSSTDHQAGGPALNGYCSVCYFTANKAVKGSEKYSSKYEGETYLFDTQQSKALFDSNPGKYVPQYDGYCAYGVSFGKKIEVDPTVFAIVDDKLYLNKNRVIGKSFNKDQKGYIAKADSQWPKIQ